MECSKSFLKMIASNYIDVKFIHLKHFHWFTKRNIKGDYLRDKYADSTRVKPTRGGRLRLHRRNVKIPTANDLVFIKESPDYCHHNSTTGSLGTTGRVCQADSKGPDGCDLMCCGRGYNRIKTKVKERCKCKFHWCCYVECKTCTKPVELTVCK